MNSTNTLPNANNTTHWSIAWGTELLPPLPPLRPLQASSRTDTQATTAMIEHLFGFLPCTPPLPWDSIFTETQLHTIPDSDDHFILNDDFSILFALEEFAALV